jgi:aspartyl-tRNA(Asn)/glutamyl-tRNA(Gln) amidotransferase subunit A
VAYMTAAELTASFSAGHLSPVEVTQMVLDRIRHLDVELNAYITVTPDFAMRAARDSEHRYRTGAPLGPLDGVSVGVKDVIDMAGVRTTANSRRHAARVPTVDATAVRRARDGGAVLLGKHTTYEMAALPPDSSAPDELAKAARNPWDHTVTTGGSSSGSAAALAAGLCTLAIGTDTGGSIRNPSSFCGVTGLKPSRGRVSRFGVVALSRSLDAVGPMARSADDAARLLRAIEGIDAADAQTVSLREMAAHHPTEAVAGMHLGVPRSLIGSANWIDAETLASYQAALATFEELGAAVRSIELPDYEFVNVAGQTILLAEAFSDHGDDARQGGDLYGSRFRELLMQGAMLTAADLVVAVRARELIAREAQRVMRSVDLILLPTTPHPARTIEAESAIQSWARRPLTRYFSLTGQPAISIPCGFTAAGLPIGLEIAAGWGQDERVLAAATAFQEATAWHLRRPRLLG